MEEIRIATVCMNSPPGKIGKNLDRIEFFVREASKKGVDFICFPEASITGYLLRNPEDIYSETLSENTIEKIAEIAVANGLVVIAGIIEITDKKKPFISQIVAGPDGLLGIYRKTHLSPQEKKVYSAGNNIKTFCSKDIIFGIQLCYEAHFPEISTVMALKGAEIIFIPHASPRGSPEKKIKSWLRHLPSRAFDNGLFIVACNQVGETREGFSFPGVAVTLDPSGLVIAQYRGNREKMVLVDIKIDDLRKIRKHRMKYFLPNRRPELYMALVEKRSPFPCL